MSYPRVRIGEILELKYGKSLPADIRSGAGYKVYGSNGMTGLHEVAITSSPVIIVGRKGSIGEIHFSEKPCWPIDTTYYVESFGDSVAPRWLYHRLQNLNLKALNKAVAIPGLNRNDVYQLEIALPPLEEQRRIAAILDKTNELNRLRDCYQALCRDVEVSIFYKEFGSPGVNPFGWPTVPLAEMAEIFSDGPFGSNLKSSHYVESGIRVVRLQNIGIGAFLDDDQAFIDPSHYETIKKHSCLPGDVLIGTLGDPNLRACILPDGIPVAINKADCIQMRCDTSRSATAYITHLLNLPEVNQMASSLILGQTRGRISMGRLKGFEVPMPPLEKQIQFVRKIDALNSLRKRGASSASSIRDLIDSYSSWAFAPKDCQ